MASVTMQFVSTERVTPFICAEPVSELYLLLLPGLFFERRADSPDCCKCQEYAKDHGRVGADSAPLGAGSGTPKVSRLTT